MSAPIPWTDRQLALPGEAFLDHVGWMTPDFDRAAAAFEKLGFQLTPLAVHADRDPASGEMVKVGSCNRLAMLPTGYLEFLTAVDGVDTPVSRHLRAAIARYHGVHLLAFGVADADATASALRERGVELHPTVHLRREVQGPRGDTVEAAFTVIRARLDSIPEARTQAVTHHTPDYVWQRRLLPAENALAGLTDVTFEVADPAQSAARIKRFLGDAGDVSAAGESGEVDIRLDRGRLRFERAPAGSAPLPRVRSVGLLSDDCERTARYFAAAGVVFTPGEGGRLTVDAAGAAGAELAIRSRADVSSAS